MDGNCSMWRVRIPAKALVRRGHTVTESSLFEPLAPQGTDGLPYNCPPLAEIDLFVYQRPTMIEHAEEIAHLRELGFPVIVDNDDLFMPGCLPPDNPAFYVFHPKVKFKGDKTDEPNRRMQNMHICMRAANLLTVATPKLAEEYKRLNKRIIVLPNCWDDTNPNWQQPNHTKPPLYQGRFTIFFGGSMTHIGDVATVSREIEAFLADHGNAEIFIAGDKRLMNLFLAVNDGQKRFQPPVPFDQYPLIVKQSDIIIAPLREIRFNESKSDIRLLEAGLAESPWVASTMPAYQQWEKGGLLARRPRDWPKLLQRLYNDPELRQSLAAEGHQKALSRAISANIQLWERAYERAIDSALATTEQTKYKLWYIRRTPANRITEVQKGRAIYHALRNHFGEVSYARMVEATRK